MTDESSIRNLSGELALFGPCNCPNIVSIECEQSSGIRIFRRQGTAVTSDIGEYLPWLLTRSRIDRNSGHGIAKVTELKGEGYRYLTEFTSQDAFNSTRFKLSDASTSTINYFGAKAALVKTGLTLFHSMRFEDIVRLQFDIETFGLDPEPESARVFLIAVSDNRGMVELLEGDEPELIRKFVDLVCKIDPDVIEGHNVFGFDLPYLMTRAKRHGVPFAIGRNGSEPYIGRERNYAIGGASRPFKPVAVYGRHVLDTYLIVQRFDWAKGSLSSYGLKECARNYGFAHEQRVELPGAKIGEIYITDPALVREYARQDVVETRMLADLVTPVEFYQTQMVPDNYGNAAITGSGERINSIFMRGYLQAGIAVPLSERSRPFPGGYTEVRRNGVVERVVKADVESLYPSLMLSHKISPASDTLDLFLPCLKVLTERRIDAKRQASEAADSSVAQYWDGVQNSFKILINSFYGYLAGPFPWNDYKAAKRVTELGRELVIEVAARMERSGSQIIEIDTDGVYFVPPPAVVGDTLEREYVKEIGSALRPGIRLAFDGRFARMLSIKTKNYVLEGYDGKRIIKGSSLRSRADERFGRRFLESAINFLMLGDLKAVGDLYKKTVQDLQQHRIGIEDIVRRERVTSKTFSSSQKKRSAKVAEGVAIGDHVWLYERSDGQLALQSEYNGPSDINVAHYIQKLYRFARRLEDAFGGEFSKYIYSPGSRSSEYQTTLELF